jgi:hypothetical protein
MSNQSPSCRLPPGEWMSDQLRSSSRWNSSNRHLLQNPPRSKCSCTGCHCRPVYISTVGQIIIFEYYSNFFCVLSADSLCTTNQINCGSHIWVLRNFHRIKRWHIFQAMTNGISLTLCHSIPLTFKRHSRGHSIITYVLVYIYIKL